MKWQQFMAAGGVLVLLGAGWAAARLTPPATALASTGGGSTNGTTISVTATAHEQVQPNLAVIDTGISTRAATATQAQSENDSAMQKLQAALESHGVAKSDIQTLNYSIYPHYSNPGSSNKPQINGFSANDQIEVKLSKLSQVGAILDLLTKSGANQIDGVSYRLQNPSSAQLTLYRNAIAKADAKAQAIAKSLGATITGVQSVSTGNNAQPGPITEFSTAAATNGSSAPVSPQSQNVSVSVHVTYAISGASATAAGSLSNSAG